MPKRSDVSRQFDAVAEALILADPDEASSLEEIVTATESLAGSAKRRKEPWADEAKAFLTEARTLTSAEGADLLAALEELGRRFGTLQGLATRAPAPAVTTAAPSSSPATAPAPDALPCGQAASLAGDEELLRDFVARAFEHLESADEGLLVLERDPSDADSLNAVFRAFHTIKGMAGFLALTDIERLAHDTESALDGPRKGAGPLDSDAFDRVFAAVDGMKALVGHVLAPVAPEASPDAPSAGQPAREARAPQHRARGAVRVDEERLDRLLDTIGELVIAEAMFSEGARRDIMQSESAPQLARLDKITRELQEMAMSLRMVPLHGTFVRMARLVRDTARKAGKDVELVTFGDDTELDKLVVDRISDPLIHMLRNAVDHGIEPVADRRAAGKPTTGRIELRAFHAGGGIHIEVSDDGAGLDPAAILSAARARGLVRADEAPDDRDLVELIFAPGLSTTANVTDVSGRGVGMDVVRRTIESLRGEVTVTSRSGEGTRIAIRLPLTLAIIDGMVVRVGAERYIIPTLSIERSVRPDAEHVSSVLGRGRLVAVGEELVPLLDLSQVFGIEDAETDPSRGIVVVISESGQRVGLIACEIIGQQQIVIKSLGEGMRDTQGVAGGAIMPDGRVGLIVDVGGLVKLARS